MHLVWPAREYLDSYKAALARGWSPDNVRPEAGREELAEIERDADAFISRQVDREGKAPPVTLPDGSTVARLPGFRLWMWDGEFCGVIGFRWQKGTPALPPYCLGHIGFAVVPWKRKLGYATRALGQLLPLAKAEGLPYVELTSEIPNVASQAAIRANGGVLYEEFEKLPAYGGGKALRFRIQL